MHLNGVTEWRYRAVFLDYKSAIDTTILGHLCMYCLYSLLCFIEQDVSFRSKGISINTLVFQLSVVPYAGVAMTALARVTENNKHPLALTISPCFQP
jgi:hypothetical protein